MENSKILIRPSDKEEFIEVRQGIFSIKKSLEEFPNNIHHEYSEEVLINLGFAEKKVIEINQYWIEDYPEMIWEIPCGDKIIIVSYDPYFGLSTSFKTCLL